MTPLLAVIMNYVPAAILLCGIAFWRFSTDIETVLPRIICAAACAAAIGAAQRTRYLWVGSFGGLAVLFNPFSPDMVSRIAFFGLYFLCVSIGLIYLAVQMHLPARPAIVYLRVSYLAQTRESALCHYHEAKER